MNRHKSSESRGEDFREPWRKRHKRCEQTVKTTNHINGRMVFNRWHWAPAKMIRGWNQGARTAKISLKENWQRVDPEPSGDVRGRRPHWQAWQWHFVKRSDPLSRSQRGSSHWSMVPRTGQDRARKSEGMKSKKSKHTGKHTSEELMRL